MSEHKLRTRTICLSRKTFKPVYIEDALDWKIYRAAQTPGPGAHMLINAFAICIRILEIQIRFYKQPRCVVQENMAAPIRIKSKGANGAKKCRWDIWISPKCTAEKRLAQAFMTSRKRIRNFKG